jgi:multidrug resistance protein, MATE family
MWNEMKQTLRLGWPIILGNLSQVALGILDSAMVGAIHSSQLAAASFVNNILTIPLVLGMGLTTAITPLVAAANGRGDTEAPLRILYNGIWVVGIFALLMALVVQFNGGIVFLMGQDKIVEDLSVPYLKWMIWGMLPMVLFLSMKQFADGLGQTRWPMYLSLSVIPINFGLNYLFIYGYWGFPRMELQGAGLATLFSRITIMIGMFSMLAWSKVFAPYRQQWQQKLILQRDQLRDVIRIGVPAALQYGMEAGAFAVSGIIVGWLGFVQQAAHQIALGLASLTFMVSLGISAAGSIRVAYAFGQENLPHARRIGITTLFLAAGYGLFCALMFILARHQLPLLFNHEPEVVRFATILLFFAAIFQISDSIQAVGVGLLRGLQDVRIPTLFVALAYWVVGIPAGYFMAFTLKWNTEGIWAGLVLGLSVSAILLTTRFLRLSKPKNS